MIDKTNRIKKCEIILVTIASLVLISVLILGIILWYNELRKNKFEITLKAPPKEEKVIDDATSQIGALSIEVVDSNQSGTVIRYELVVDEIYKYYIVYQMKSCSCLFITNYKWEYTSVVYYDKIC